MVDALNSLLCLCHRYNLGITDVLKLFCKKVSAQLLLKWEIGNVGMQCLHTSLMSFSFALLVTCTHGEICANIHMNSV